ncbi:hypothetical protein BDV93DRAFT_252509 [Ceratobasidium sp. AG-I]|nr:hypothetical protein BDV93DRAFT_252509 [Ceratobasidium sp. AG-I]
MHPPTRCVFEVPELVELICDSVEKRSLPKLLTVSRLFFHCVVPLAWKEVSGVAKLLILLPSSDLDRYISSVPADVYPCDHDQLARFNLYAPFIHKLDSGAELDESIYAWALLLSKVPYRPLLPNLRTLVIPPPGFHRYTITFIEYTDTLLCPTLSDIRIAWNPQTWIDVFEAGDLVTRMAATCPNLTKLKIFLGSSRHPDDSGPVSTHLTASLFSHISQFQGLRALHSSSMVLSPGVLQLLGDLPHLESLGASVSIGDETDTEEIPIANLILPEHSFPALRHFEIDCMPSTDVFKLWQTPPLVRNLVSVRVKFDEDSTESLNNMICIICRGSPRTTDLELDLGQGYDIELLSATVEHLQRLPLQRVRFRDARADCQSLALALPNVEHLDMKGMRILFGDLTYIPKHMPKLQYLSVELCLWAMSGVPAFLHNSASPSSCHIDSRFTFEKDLDVNDPDFDEHVENIARYTPFHLLTSSSH